MTDRNIDKALLANPAQGNIRIEGMSGRILCWNCNKAEATEPASDAAQFTRETTQGLCDKCRAIALGPPISMECLYASVEDWPENL